MAAQAFLGDRPRPRTLAARQKASSIVSVGDILLGDAASETLRRNGYGYPFERVSELLDGKLVMGLGDWTFEVLLVHVSLVGLERLHRLTPILARITGP